MAIESIIGARQDINEMLAKIRDISNRSKVFADNSLTYTEPTGFDTVMQAAKQAVSHVNDLQTQSDGMKNAYASGDPNVSMSQVVLAAQKSKLAFEGLITVRNKILTAYKDIMSMPV